MSVITVSAPYGAGGSVVAPRLARELDAQLLDRAIPVEVARTMAISLAEAEHHDDAIGSTLDRFLARLIPLGAAYGAPVAPEPDTLQRATEDVIRRRAQEGDVVVLGRAGAIVLAGDPRAFHVRLDGPAGARVARAMAMDGIGRAEAEERLRQTDQARDGYVRHFYRCDARDPRHYHLVLDATAYDLDDVVAIIVGAHRRWVRRHAAANELRGASDGWSRARADE